jgi:hypothetical protein
LSCRRQVVMRLPMSPAPAGLTNDEAE